MTGWFERTVVATDRLPLFCFFVGVIVGFGFIRFSVRMIRARVRWWPGNITPGELHIHHVVFGVVFMLVAGVAGLVIPVETTSWRAVAAGLFGIGAALVLDEFALLLHLSDVYWSEKGRTSIDAVFVAIALSGLLLLGLRPLGANEFLTRGETDPAQFAGAALIGINLTLAAITLLKGKIWTGLLGIFVPVLLIVGTVRLARPHSPWARWFYRGGSRWAERRRVRAAARERRYRQPIIMAKIRVQELIAGRHDLPLPRPTRPTRPPRPPRR
ncbi:hypothetical protein O7632_26220 [Solwaraspora sp. WMMD406]|uniref:hypothetical protein n=1 Tax=Solwaraspora sp. WMMD406 TaxID=3016095 RepID=UPI002416ABBA|nr:hypothetical protein [Solwaraspora sp. WMMD406]MDG4767560.1 hypothetical protein [Solwaraspora sp. WMMD406]